MGNLIEVQTPDGETHRHSGTLQNGQVEARELADGTVEVLGVHETPEIRGWGGGVERAASRTEQVLGTYPPGSTVTHR